MPQTQTRVAGSGFTTLSWQGRAIALLDSFDDSGVTPVAEAVAVHPLGSRHPIEIATSRAVGAGTLTLRMRELWNEPVWWQLGQTLRGTWDIVAVWERLAANPQGLTAQMVIKPPGGNSWRGKVYHNLVITDVPDNETITLQSMTVSRSITVMYTHSTPLTQAA